MEATRVWSTGARIVSETSDAADRPESAAAPESESERECRTAREIRDQKRAWRREVAEARSKRTETLAQRLAEGPIRLAFRLAELAFMTLPLEHSLQLGRVLGGLGYLLLRGRRRVALENLERAFGAEKSSAERRRIARRSFENVACVAIEFVRFGRITTRELCRRVMTIHEPVLHDCFSKERGVLALSGHIGTFEYIAARGGRPCGYTTSLMGRRVKPPAVDRIVTGLRAARGVPTINSADGLVKVLRRLRNNEGVGIVLDQNMRQGVGIFVNVFGCAASTTPGLALLALRRKIPVMPVFCVRVGDGGRHAVFFLREIPLVETGDRDQDVLINTQRFSLVVEAVVRRWPEQWFWVHRRWRVRPEGEATPGPVAQRDESEFVADIEAQLDAVVLEIERRRGLS